MDGFAAVDFGFAREVLQRGIAVLYLVAFISTLNQFRPLLGEHGLLPAPRFLARAARAERGQGQGRRLLRPTLFRRVRYTDGRLAALCWAGILVSALLVTGVPQLGPPWVPMLCFLALWFGYMSITSLGQTFYGFGWEMMLLELGFLAAFLGSGSQPPPTVVIVLFWWLLFRLEFGAGMIKIRGGREWRDLTALMYHHETQPMPGPFSRPAHLLPRWFHKGEVLGNHFAQLVVPWFLFAPILGLWIPGPVPGLIGTAAAVVVIVTQLWLVLTGNFAWLNWATVVLAFSAVSVAGSAAAGSGGTAGVGVDGLPIYWFVVTCAVALAYVWLSWPALHNLFFAEHQVMNGAFNRLQLANAYGAFGTVTKVRTEYVIEGTLDEDPGTDDWHEYGFKGKPGDVHRVPRQFAPYHLRLDWCMWFLPLGAPIEGWFTAFLARLLDADAPTLRLLRHDPFAGQPPRWIRVVSYRYRFATREQHRADGAVWVRDRRHVLIRPLSRREFAD